MSFDVGNAIVRSVSKQAQNDIFGTLYFLFKYD